MIGYLQVRGRIREDLAHDARNRLDRLRHDSAVSGWRPLDTLSEPGEPALNVPKGCVGIMEAGQKPKRETR